MNTARVEQLANAVLYEGYILYPYRPSALKNRQRFNFGVLYPREYCVLHSGADSDEMRIECLVVGDGRTTIEIKVRFLQLVTREQWQEGIDRSICLPACALGDSLVHPFIVDGLQPLEGDVELRTAELGKRLFKVSVIIRNLTPFRDAGQRSRDEALLRSMVSVHSILQSTAGEFISLLDPPDEFKSAAVECNSRGAWPVLAGDEGQKDLILASPIILYDYPQIAPESVGDLCDSCEIDEILALRILTMTDAEKLEVRNGDDRARAILERTEMMPPEHFTKLHGALRGLRAVDAGEDRHDRV